MKVRFLGAVAATLFIAGIAGAANAGPLEDGRTAVQNGDIPRAVHLFGIAAAKGDREAEYRLAELYSSGKVAGKTTADAVEWYRKAADQGQADAQFTLGGILADGDVGVPIDLVEAYKWVGLAARHLPPDEAFKQKLAIGALGVLEAKMSPEDVAKAKAEVAAWVQK